MLWLLIPLLAAMIGLFMWLLAGAMFRTFDAPKRELPGVRRGEKPMSLSINRQLFRFQRRTALFAGPDFYRMFEDGPWKWEGRQRFAGVIVSPTVSDQKINVGHYFALTASCARAEISHYVTSSEIVARDYELVTVDISLDDVLDLTSPTFVARAAHEMGWRGDLFGVFGGVLTRETGGADITADLGYFATRSQYSSALFLSVRAMDDKTYAFVTGNRWWDKEMEEYFKTVDVDELRFREDLLCVVMFSGAQLIRSIHRFKIGAGPWEDNPLYRMSEAEVDRQLTFNAEYRLSQDAHIFYFYGDEPVPRMPPTRSH